METFVPVTDELLYDARPPAQRLVPYRVGLPCFHWQAVIDRDGVCEEFRSHSARQPSARRTGRRWPSEA